MSRAHRSVCHAVIAVLIALGTAASAAPVPHLRTQGSATQLIVDGAPFLMLGGELGNSSASDLAYMEPIWPKLAVMGLNTVLAPVYWERLEPKEGTFDFSLVDGLLAGARAHDLKLVLLWFGSWKNSMSCYAPLWVKTDPARFPRARTSEDQGLEILSPFYAASRDADARAFTALMRHLRDVDGGQHTVIMVQVENEIGMIPEARDYSPAANEQFTGAVPRALMAYLERDKNSLTPEIKARWELSRFKTAGTWEEVFGPGLETDEIFMAWHFALYVDFIAEAGRAAYDLPMYVNAALIRPNARPGQYPSAGPLPHLIDIWRAGAPQIDFLAPDIYFPNFAEWCDKYHQAGNPLFIPEAGRGSGSAVYAFYAIGRHDALGFSPFSIESTDRPQNEPLARIYDILAQLTPLILERQGTDRMTGVALDKDHRTEEVTLGDYTLKVSHDFTWGWSSGSNDANRWPDAGGLILATGPDEYVIAGSGIIVTFAPHTPGDPIAGIGTIEEGRYVDGQWVPGRTLNGDQSHQGRHLRIPAGSFGIQRVKLYRYR